VGWEDVICGEGVSDGWGEGVEDRICGGLRKGINVER